MAGTTPIALLPYPTLTDVPNAQSGFQNLANALDTKVIPRFNTPAARDIAITSPSQGMVVYILVTQTHETWNGTAWVPIASPGSWGPWSAYTPQWLINGVAGTLGNGTLTGAYRLNGKAMMVSIALQFGSTTNAGAGTYTFGIPSGYTMLDSGRLQGTAVIRDQSAAAHFIGGCTHSTSTTVDIRYHGGNLVTSTAPMAFASGDFIRILLILEVA